MKVLTEKALLSLVTFSMIASFFSVLGAPVTMPAEGDAEQGLTLVASASIQVNSDIELTSLVTSRGFQGTGGTEDPYIIENLSFIVNGQIDGIHIGNTSSHLIIRNCTVQRVIDYRHPYPTGAAIMLSNSTNCIVENNTCSGNGYGIFVMSSEKISISNNVCNNDRWSGVFIKNSERISIAHNNCTNNRNRNFFDSSPSGFGIQLDNSTSNSISENICNNNADYGVYLSQSSSLNLLTNNSCSLNGWHGIYVEGSNNNTASDNRCSGNRDGIFLWDSSNTTVSWNNCSDNRGADNDGGGVVILFSGRCFVTNNTSDRNAYGLIITGPGVSYNVVKYNSFDSNYVGVSLHFGDNVTITANSVQRNSGNGITLGNANYNLIFGNVLRGNNANNPDHIQVDDFGINTWNCSTYGNYWSTLTAPDIDGDGIVDTPVAMVFNTSEDYRPLATPLLDITQPSPYTFTNAPNLELSGTANDIGGPSTITWLNRMSGISGKCSGVSSWTAEVPMQVGTNNIIVSISGPLGIGYIEKLTVVYDPLPPAVSITYPRDGACFNYTWVWINWLANDALSGVEKTEFRHDGGQWYDLADETPFLDLSSPDNPTVYSEGNHTVHVRSTDRAHNVNETSVTFTIDTSRPNLTILTPLSGKSYCDSDLSVTWNSSDRYSGLAHTEISTDGSHWFGTSGDSHALDLGEGRWTISIRASDRAGNIITSSVQITIDTTPPVISYLSPTSSNQSTGTKITMLFDEAMNETATTIVVDGMDGTLKWSGTHWATFTFSTSLKGNTTYTVTVNGKDQAGNLLVPVSWRFSTANVGTVSGIVSDLGGRPVAGAVVNLTSTSGRNMTTVTNISGYYSFHDVPIGDYTISVIKDNYTSQTSTFTLNGDNVAFGGITLDKVLTSSGPADDSLLLLVALGSMTVAGSLITVLYMRKRGRIKP